MIDTENLLKIIKRELSELNTKFLNAKVKWKIERYESQIIVLKKILNEYIEGIVREQRLYFDEELGIAITMKVDDSFLVGLKSDSKESIFDSYYCKNWSDVISCLKEKGLDIN